MDESIVLNEYTPMSLYYMYIVILDVPVLGVTSYYKLMNACMQLHVLHVDHYFYTHASFLCITVVNTHDWWTSTCKH